MRREVYSKMLKKRQQKPSTRLCDGVVVRDWIEYKSHHHVYASRTFSKRPTWCKLTITPIRRALTDINHELIFGHSPQMLTTRIVRKLYPRNSKHIHNKLRCDRNARTSNTSKNLVHVFKREVLNDQSRACWTKNPEWAWENKWPRRHTMTPIPDCEWQWEGQCRRSLPVWLGVPNEHLI